MPGSIKYRLEKAQVASCSCGTKPPEPLYHDDMCRYRLFCEAVEEIERLEKAADTNLNLYDELLVRMVKQRNKPKEKK